MINEKLLGKRAISQIAIIVVVVVIIVIAAAGGIYFATLGSSKTTTTSVSTATSTVTSTSTATTVSTATSTVTANSTSLTNINIVVVPADDTAPVYIALKNGYFAQQGLNVTIKVLGSPVLETDALASGAAQIGLLSTPSLMSDFDQHFNYQFIAPATIVQYPNGSQVGSYLPPTNGVVNSPHAVVVLASSGITSLTQLPGKTVGMASLPIEVGMNVVLGQLGVNASKVNYQILPTPSLLGALEQKRVDAISLIQPFTEEMILANQSGPTAGQFRIIGDDQHYASAMIAGWIASPAWANYNQAIVQKFLTGLREGVRQMAHPSE